MASDEKKILIVEDEKVIRDAVSAYLERENYVVKGVGDGQSAVEEFEKHAFDLVILDLMLPKLSWRARLPCNLEIPLMCLSLCLLQKAR